MASLCCCLWVTPESPNKRGKASPGSVGVAFAHQHQGHTEAGGADRAREGFPGGTRGCRDQVLGWSIGSSLEDVVAQCGERKMLRMTMRTRMKEEDRRLVLADSRSDPDPRIPQGRSHTWRREWPSWKLGSGSLPLPRESDTRVIPEDGVN